MGTWIMETNTAIYLMEGDVYLEKILKTPKDNTNTGELKANIVSMKDWFYRTDAPRAMVIATSGSEPEAKPIPNDHPGSGSGNDLKKPKVTWIPAHPLNFEARRNGSKISKIVFHNTVGSTEGTIATFQNSANQVSAHYVIDRSGEIFQMVSAQNCAYHAGNKDMNHNSIGIEHEATDSLRGLTPEQEESSIGLMKYLMHTYDILADNIIAHRCVTNTDCPSLIFPLNALLNEKDMDPGKLFKDWINKHF